MEDFLNSYITCNTVKEEGWTSFLFYPRGVAINGTVEVLIDTRRLRPSSPKRHPKVREALRMASQFHPNHAVSLRLRQPWLYGRGRDLVVYRVTQ